jgi:hypothetical protein
MLEEIQDQFPSPPLPMPRGGFSPSRPSLITGQKRAPSANPKALIQPTKSKKFQKQKVPASIAIIK